MNGYGSKLNKDFGGAINDNTMSSKSPRSPDARTEKEPRKLDENSRKISMAKAPGVELLATFYGMKHQRSQAMIMKKQRTKKNMSMISKTSPLTSKVEIPIVYEKSEVTTPAPETIV